MDNFTLKLAEGLQNSGLIGPMHKGAGQAAEKIYQPSISDIESVAESLITNPPEVWDWHYEFKRMVRQTTPNVCHSVISELMQFCEENDIECNLITQV